MAKPMSRREIGLAGTMFPGAFCPLGQTFSVECGAIYVRSTPYTAYSLYDTVRFFSCVSAPLEFDGAEIAATADPVFFI